MPQSRLQIYQEPRDGQSTDQRPAFQMKPSGGNPETVTVRAGEIFPVLADALASGRTWLKDFENDEVTIPFDLYEVILAYQHYQRLSA